MILFKNQFSIQEEHSLFCCAVIDINYMRPFIFHRSINSCILFTENSSHVSSIVFGFAISIISWVTTCPGGSIGIFELYRHFEPFEIGIQFKLESKESAESNYKMAVTSCCGFNPE